MDLDTQQALSSLETGLTALYALLVSYSLSVIGAIILIIVGYFAAGVAERAVRGALKKVRGIDATIRQFFGTITRYAILVLVFVMVLGQFGVQTASILAAIGAIGLAIGLALQGTLQNIAAGIMLLILRPFRVGEFVDVGGLMGTVEDVGLFASRLRDPEGVYILAPNSTLWNQPVKNFNRNGVRRADVAIGIGYEDDVELAQKILTDLAAADERVQRAPAPEVFLSQLGDSAVVVTLRFWSSDKTWFGAKNDLTMRAKKAFDENGISIPFPQREVIVRGEAGRLPPEQGPAAGPARTAA